MFLFRAACSLRVALPSGGGYGYPTSLSKNCSKEKKRATTVISEESP